MNQKDEDGLLLYRALGAEIGLVLRTDNVARALDRLNAAKQAASDPALSILSLRRNPYEQDEIFVLKDKPSESPTSEGEP